MGFFDNLKSAASKVKEKISSFVTDRAQTLSESASTGREQIAQTAERGGEALRESSERVRESEVAKAAFPEEDPIRDIALSVIPVGRAAKTGAKAAKGISKLGKISKGKLPVREGTTLKEIGRINKFQEPTKVTKAQQVGKFTKKNNKRTKFQTNAKTVEKTNSLLLKVAKQFKKPAVIVGTIGTIIGTYPWAEWALGEAREGMIFNMQKALNTGDQELINEYIETSEEIFDTSIWEAMARLTPGVNIAFGFSQKAKSLQAQWKVNNKIAEDELIKIETGESEDERWKRIREEELEADKEAVRFYNEERKQMVRWEAEARKNQRNEDAAFWANERAKQRVKEAEDRKAIADFWIQYRKTALKISQDSRPSNLNFGLL